LPDTETSSSPKDSAVASRRPHVKHTLIDAERWAEKYRQRISILKIAKEEGVDPDTVSGWLKKLGVAIRKGQHFVEQSPIRIPADLLNLLGKGPAAARELIQCRVWGVVASPKGIEQLEKYCHYVTLHREGLGVEETAARLGVHRSTVLEWRSGTDTPYLAKTALAAIQNPAEEGWKLIPVHVGSGGNELAQWISVPINIVGTDDILKVIGQLEPTQETYERAGRFAIRRDQIESMRLDLFGYLLGFMLGDASKLGGEQERFTSVNVDLQLSLKHESNQRLGEFLCMCVNSLGLRMHRTADKQPSGESKFAQQPIGAYRWNSERSPLLAWMFSVCLGLRWGQRTSVDQVKMNWIDRMPKSFILRFVQALADSDGSVKKYLVEIASMPNAEFITSLLHHLGLTNTYTRHENGKPMRTVIRAIEAANLPVFNEFSRGYRFDRLMKYKRQ